MTTDQMKKFVRDHFEEFVNKRNASVIRKNMTPDFYGHDGAGGKATGVDGDEQMMVSMYKAMPDLCVTVGDMIAEGDKVMCRNIWRFLGDRIAERWATVGPPAEGGSWTAA